MRLQAPASLGRATHSRERGECVLACARACACACMCVCVCVHTRICVEWPACVQCTRIHRLFAISLWRCISVASPVVAGAVALLASVIPVEDRSVPPARCSPTHNACIITAFARLLQFTPHNSQLTIPIEPRARACVRLQASCADTREHEAGAAAHGNPHQGCNHV